MGDRIGPEHALLSQLILMETGHLNVINAAYGRFRANPILSAEYKQKKLRCNRLSLDFLGG